MKCDKCHLEVAPSNNALLYDAALSALSHDVSVPVDVLTKFHPEQQKDTTIIVYSKGYHPLVDCTWADFDVFRQGEIVPGDARQSIENVMEKHYRARHLYPEGSCEGSPSRRMNIDQGLWGNREPMGSIAEVAKHAYELIRSLETPASVDK